MGHLNFRFPILGLFITRYKNMISTSGYPPTLQEIARHLHISGNLGVLRHLKALDIKPDFVQALYGLAKTYMEMDRVPDAIAKLQKAVDISPDSAVLHFELARAYALDRQYTKALNAYHKVAEINPNSTLADRALIEARKIKIRK